jgi:hypothetical protein
LSFPYDSPEGPKNHTLQQEIIRQTPAAGQATAEIRGHDLMYGTNGMDGAEPTQRGKHA